MRFAVIPARGGSKRIPRKNIRDFCGKPMMVWSIEAALTSGCFDQVIVSTDDAEIGEVARRAGAFTPFIRPRDLSDDFTGTTAVVQHAVRYLEAQGIEVDEVCCIYATAPFVQAQDIRTGLNLLLQSHADYAFSVATYAFPVQRALRVTDAGGVEPLDPSQENTRSQDLEEAFHDAGQFYWGTVRAWRDARPIFSAASVPVVLPRYRVQDIDTLEDWERAVWMFTAMKSALQEPGAR